MKRILLSLVFAAALLSCDKAPDNGGSSESYDRIYAVNEEWDGVKRGELTYQLLVYSFADSDGDGIGDFQGIIDKLDYIDGLGATAIWLSPIHPAMSYHGYDVLDYSAVNPEYGTMDDFRRLVSEAHNRDIKIYVDYVLNHSGRQHPWFQQAISSEDNEYRDYYIFSSNPAKDIAEGKIPMIATEGEAGYDAGQWFAAASSESGRYQFLLDWTNPAQPFITVEETEDAADSENPDKSEEGAKYLYFGDPAKCLKFYDDGDGMYSLTVDFSSPWGFLVRTSDDESWPAGTKYGAKSATESEIQFGVPFPLYSSSNNNNVKDIRMPGSFMFHSHFWTDWFADLNYGPASSAEQSPAFKAVVDAARIWMDAGVDGMRLDAVKHIYHNESSDENPVFLAKFYDAVNSIFKSSHSGDVYMVGEVMSDYMKAAPYYKGLPGIFDFSFWWDLKDAVNSGSGCNFAERIIGRQEVFRQYRSDFVDATKLSNHDENRALSDLGGSVQKAKLAAAVLLTSPGEPYIYYGEELGFPGDKSKGDEFVRSPMQWGDSYTTSYSDKNNKVDVKPVPEQQADSSSVYSMYESFAHARHIHPALSEGSIELHPDIDASGPYGKSLAAWYRVSSGEKLLVLHNFGQSAVSVPVYDQLGEAVACNGTVSAREEKGGFTRVKMEAYSSVVFVIK